MYCTRGGLRMVQQNVKQWVKGTASARRACSICRTMLETRCSAGASPSDTVNAADPLRLSFRQTLLPMAAGTNSSMISGRCPGCDTNADTSKPSSRTAELQDPFCVSPLREVVSRTHAGTNWTTVLAFKQEPTVG